MMQEKLRVFILGRNEQELAEISHKLDTTRPVESYVYSDLKEFLVAAMKARPDLFAISMNYSHPKIGRFPKFFKMAMNIPVISFCENTEPKSIKAVNLSQADYKITGKLTAHNLWMKLLNFIKKKEKEEKEKAQQKKKMRPKEIMTGQFKNPSGNDLSVSGFKKKNHTMVKSSSLDSIMSQLDSIEESGGLAQVDRLGSFKQNGDNPLHIQSSDATKFKRRNTAAEMAENAANENSPGGGFGQGFDGAHVTSSGFFDPDDANGLTGIGSSGDDNSATGNAGDGGSSTGVGGKFNKNAAAGHITGDYRERPSSIGVGNTFNDNINDEDPEAEANSEWDESTGSAESFKKKKWKPGNLAEEEEENQASDDPLDAMMKSLMDSEGEEPPEEEENELDNLLLGGNKSGENDQPEAEDEFSNALVQKEGFDGEGEDRVKKEVDEEFEKNLNLLKESCEIALKQTFNAEKLDEPREFDSEHLVALTVNHSKLKGYLLFTNSFGHHESSEKIIQMKDIITDHLEKNGALGDIGPFVDFSVPETDFPSWANHSCDFTVTCEEENGRQICLSFLKREQVLPTYRDAEDKKMILVDLQNIPPGTLVNFDAFIYLPRNNKYVRLLKKDRSLGLNQVKRLIKEDKGQRLYIPREEKQKFIQFFIQNTVTWDFITYLKDLKKAS